jgi:hypothetical protein
MKVEADTGCTIGLRISIYQQRFEFEYSQTGRQVNGGSSFSHTSFLIRHTDYSCHSVFSLKNYHL